MKKLFVALFVVLAIVACKDKPAGVEKSEFKPYKVGSFQFVDKLNADYIGISGKSTNMAMSISDTVEITAPDSLDFTISNSNIEDQQNKKFLTFDIVNHYTRDRSNYRVSDIELQSNVIDVLSIRSSISNDRLSVTMDASINCTVYNQLTSLEYIYLVSEYFDDEGERYPKYVYRIHVDSALTVMNEFFSCP